MGKNFQLPGRSAAPVKGRHTVSPGCNVTLRSADTPWYVPGLRRRQHVRETVEFTFSHEDASLTYLGLKLTYTDPIE